MELASLEAVRALGDAHCQPRGVWFTTLARARERGPRGVEFIAIAPAMNARPSSNGTTVPVIA